MVQKLQIHFSKNLALANHLAVSVAFSMFLDSTIPLAATTRPAVSSQLANNTARPLLKEFNQYLDMVDQIPEGQTLIEWWAVSPHFVFLNTRNQLTSWFSVAEVQCTPLPSLGIACTGSSRNHGLISVKRASIFVCWNHYQQMSQSS